MAELIQKLANVTGRVQGVWYRASTQQKAQELGVVGWVKNEPDGSVSLAAEGNSKAVQALLEWCKQGPPHAAVSQVAISEGKPEGFPGFEIRRS